MALATGFIPFVAVAAAAAGTTATTFYPRPTTNAARPTTNAAATPMVMVVFEKQNIKSPNTLICQLQLDSHPPPPPQQQQPLRGRRESLSACFTAALSLSLSLVGRRNANAAILEADDDEELLEKVKNDRKKRLERQGVITAANKETGYVQELVYKLSKVGQAIDNNDLSAASSVLGPNTNIEWVQNVNTAFSKLSSSPEEKSEADAFNLSLALLITSVGKHDAESSKTAFVSSASALEKWISLTGLVGQLKGL